MKIIGKVFIIFKFKTCQFYALKQIVERIKNISEILR